MRGSRPLTLGLWSGVGLCVASMVGSGVFLSAGYMAQEMPPTAILLAWLVGAALAMLGVAAYAELARQIPRSGGEYRYLSDFLHPAVGYAAGWVTLIIGFAQPTAINALAAAAFAETLLPISSSRWLAVVAIVALASVHALEASSKLAQNFLVGAKVLLLLGFVGLGLFVGETRWPTWQPPARTGIVSAFVGSLFYISYAFSGWNTTAYNAEAFRRPAVDVGRAMAIACLAVGGLYLLINWIFVANLNPAEASAVIGADRAILGHVVTEQLVGSAGARFMSVLAILSFVSAMSAMLMVGPHIAATMARDGALPRIFATEPGRVPRAALLFQVGVALLVLQLHSLREALEAVGATLLLFSALAASSLLVAHWQQALPRPARRTSLVCAALYAGVSVVLLYLGIRDQLHILLWLGGIVACALIAYRMRPPVPGD